MLFSKPCKPETGVCGQSKFADSWESFGGSPPPRRSLPDFELLKLLNKSKNSTVYLARDRCNRRLVALKVIEKAGRSPRQLRFVESEQQVLRLLSEDETRFSLPLLCSWEDTENFYIVTEYIGGGTLAVEILRCRQFREEKARFYLAELIVAVEELRAHRLIHRDLKPENILLTSDGHIRVIDFGYAKAFDGFALPEGLSFDVDAASDCGSFLTEASEYTTNETCGSPYFMSPEQHRGGEYRDEADDWAIGVIAHCMITGRMPFGFKAETPAEIALCVQHEPLMFQADDCVSPVAKDLIRGFLAKDRRERLTLSQMKGHAFFKRMDWDAAARQELSPPWKPYVAPPPKQPMATCPVKKGAEIEEWNPDSYFRYTATKVDLPKEEPAPAVVKNKCGVFSKVGKFFGSAFSRKEGEGPESLPSAPTPLKALKLTPTPTPMIPAERASNFWHRQSAQPISPAPLCLEAKRKSLRPLLLPDLLAKKAQTSTCTLSGRSHSIPTENLPPHLWARTPEKLNIARAGRNADADTDLPPPKKTVSYSPPPLLESQPKPGYEASTGSQLIGQSPQYRIRESVPGGVILRTNTYLRHARMRLALAIYQAVTALNLLSVSPLGGLSSRGCSHPLPVLSC
ncbi:Serine/threonine-protein kinase Sgk1 [Hypsizygus marmoreus]|uniref:Serine/threonine-protein kinase Sgk1 n=1 Tax=Hypsizygus marmoreus TaxID=39966 RepID=A0A369KG96_HYPMA|nr:Serine/threonine-protein kinase Sgk1 [Hypsizygus marmoreus]